MIFVGNFQLKPKRTKRERTCPTKREVGKIIVKNAGNGRGYVIVPRRVTNPSINEDMQQSKLTQPHLKHWDTFTSKTDHVAAATMRRGLATA